MKENVKLMTRYEGMRTPMELAKPRERDPLRMLLALVATIDARPFLGGSR